MVYIQYYSLPFAVFLSTKYREDFLMLFLYRALHMVMSVDQNTGRSHSVKIDNISFERVKHFKYLGTNLTYQNSIQEEIKSRLNSGNVAIIRCRIFCLPVCCLQI